MAAMPSEQDDLGYLWRPKKTMRDWGQSTYHIVRNWTTPGNKSSKPKKAHAEHPAMNSKRKSNAEQLVTKSSNINSSTRKIRGEQASVKGETSYRLRRNTSGRGHDTTWFVPNTYSTSKQGPKRTSVSNGSDDETEDRILNADNAGCICEQGHICSLTTSVSDSSSHLLLLSHHCSPKSSAKQILSSSPEEEQEPFPERTEGIGEIEREDFAHHVQRRETEGSDENKRKEEKLFVQRRIVANDESFSQPVRRRKAVKGRKSREHVHRHVSKPVSGKNSEVDEERVVQEVEGRERRNGSMVGKKQGDESGDENGDESGMEVVEATGNEQLDGGNQVVSYDVDMDAHHHSPSEAFPSVDTQGAVPQKTKKSTGMPVRKPGKSKKAGETQQGHYVLRSEPDIEAVQQALVNQWKGTQKQVVSMMKDLRTMKAFENIPKKEKTRYHRLQKEMLTALKNMRRGRDEYQVALFEAKQEKQRQEALQVEAQVAAVGCLLQSRQNHLMKPQQEQ